ncbi:hypothetical protein BGX29_002664 [Mortierella sp. GBA35]|nr:hypothetical protein BGX29_002664 [Mortierella sp. GBA35]KAF9088128.1 hypothetical protein BGX23_007604 [Mortierella sp. AD031]KAG0205758.1 hypothetical protein BGX33_007758 [Mortierella sp. NVP41]
MPDITAGSYLGSQAQDPNADIRKIFSERGNHQDGVGTILSFCQKESGFTVGSSDIGGFMTQLRQFSGVIDQTAFTTTSPMGPKDQVVQQINAFLALLPDKSKVDKFSGSLSGNFSSTLVHFCIDLDGERLRLYIPKIVVQGNASSMFAFCGFDTWEVNRQEMTNRADWLVEKTKLKDRIDDWTKKITSNGF